MVECSSIGGVEVCWWRGVVFVAWSCDGGLELCWYRVVMGDWSCVGIEL